VDERPLTNCEETTTRLGSTGTHKLISSIQFALKTDFPIFIYNMIVITWNEVTRVNLEHAFIGY